LEDGHQTYCTELYVLFNSFVGCDSGGKTCYVSECFPAIFPARMCQIGAEAGMRDKPADQKSHSGHAMNSYPAWKHPWQTNSKTPSIKSLCLDGEYSCSRYSRRAGPCELLLKKCVIGMKPWPRLSRPSSLSSHLS